MDDRQPKSQPFRPIAAWVVNLVVLGEYRFPMHGRDADTRVPYIDTKLFSNQRPADYDTALGCVLDRVRYKIGQCPFEQRAVTFNRRRTAPTHADSEFNAPRPCRLKVLLEDFRQHRLRID